MSMDYIHEQLRPLAVPVSDLNFDPDNSRVHDEANLRVIRESFLAFGQRAPLVVQRSGMRVRSGNGRLRVARELGWSHVAAIVCDDEDTVASAFALVDNRSAELAEWDYESLGQSLTKLALAGIDTLDLGWDKAQFEALMDASEWEPEEVPLSPSDDALRNDGVDVELGGVEGGDNVFCTVVLPSEEARAGLRAWCKKNGARLVK